MRSQPHAVALVRRDRVVPLSTADAVAPAAARSACRAPRPPRACPARGRRGGHHPPPPLSRSLPAPPRRRSAPDPPLSRSPPQSRRGCRFRGRREPVVALSRPRSARATGHPCPGAALVAEQAVIAARPRITSEPARPQMTLLRAFPLSRSSPAVAVLFSSTETSLEPLLATARSGRESPLVADRHRDGGLVGGELVGPPNCRRRGRASPRRPWSRGG